MSVIDHDGYDEILARIRDEINSGRVVYVHCWGGKGRTSTVVGCLLIDDGLDYEAAVARIAELRAETRKAGDACPESPTQHRLLKERAARTEQLRQIPDETVRELKASGLIRIGNPRRAEPISSPPPKTGW